MGVIDSLSRIALRHLSDAQFARLRAGYLGVNRYADRVRLRLHGSFDAVDLKRELGARLPQDFEILMVHSSLNHMQPFYRGDALGLVRMLIDFCGPERTLAMPAFFFGDPKIGTVYETFRTNPIFDLRRTPSQMGLATELFRRTKGTLQSRHPVYRVAARGPLAGEITEGHEDAATIAGPGTPFAVMARRDTVILGIGKDYDVITQVHHVEDLLGDGFPAPRRQSDGPGGLEVTLLDGAERLPVRLRGNGITWERDMRRLPGLLNPGDLTRWRFHGVRLVTTRAGPLTERLLEAARMGRSLYRRP